MTHTLTISEDLHDRLQQAVRRHGFAGPDVFLEYWLVNEEEARRREETVRHIDDLRERLTATYGSMPDSADLVREDREQCRR